MSTTTGHELEAINVQGLKASLQKFKDETVGTGEFPDLTAGNIVGEFSDTGAEFAYRPSAGAVDIESGYKVDHGGHLEKIKGNTVVWNQLALDSDTYVDLGLPSGNLWAKSNIDVTQPTGFAASPFQHEATFFSWGNIVGQNPANTSSFANTWGTGNDTEPYVSSAGAALTASLSADGGNDASRENNKTSWKMPSSTDFQELFDNCDFVGADGTTVIDASTTDKRVTVNGILGLYLKSKINGNLLFFACSGSGNGATWANRGSGGYYWSASFYSSNQARNLYFGSGGVAPQGGNNRYNGFAVRPIIQQGISTGKYGHKYLAKSGDIFDLTLIYGSGNEPTTVEQFESDYMKWFGKPLGYEAYDAGSLRPVKMAGLKTVGFNAWDEEIEEGSWNSVTGEKEENSNYRRSKNYIPVLAGNSYYFSSVRGYFAIYLYDKDKKYLGRYDTAVINNSVTIPSNTSFITVRNNFAADKDWFIKGNLCINLSHSGDKDGQYEPYWSSTLNVPITSLTGKLNGEGSSVVVFPDGMKKAGSVYDEILRVGNVTKAIKRVGSVDMGDLEWNYSANYSPIFNTIILKFKNASANMVCGIYQTAPVGTEFFFKDYPDMTMEAHIDYHIVRVHNFSYTDAAEFTTAMSGVILYYELETPEEYILDDFELPQEYDVDDWGTEEILLGTNGCAPILDLKYGINAGDTIKNLPHSYVSINRQNFTDAQKARARKNIGVDIIDDRVSALESADTTMQSQINWLLAMNKCAGIRWNLADDVKTIEYVGDTALKNAILSWIDSSARPCEVKKDGTDFAYLRNTAGVASSTNWLKRADGTTDSHYDSNDKADYLQMVELKNINMRFDIDEYAGTAMVLFNLDETCPGGFHRWFKEPTKLFARYDGSKNASDNSKYDIMKGGNWTGNWSASTGYAMNKATNTNLYEVTGWEIAVLSWLMAFKYQSFDMQSALGTGVQNSSQAAAEAFVNGHTDSLTTPHGKVAYAGASSTNNEAIRFMYIENPYGLRWIWGAGVRGERSIGYFTYDEDKANTEALMDIDDADETFTILATSGTCAKNVNILGVLTESGGASDRGFYDSNWSNIAFTERILYVGGASDTSFLGGSFARLLSYGVSSSGWTWRGRSAMKKSAVVPA